MNNEILTICTAFTLLKLDHGYEATIEFFFLFLQTPLLKPVKTLTQQSGVACSGRREQNQLSSFHQ